MPEKTRDEAGPRKGKSRGKKRAVREALLSWFDENARDLPWRRTRYPVAS